jgi:hypothetical protein
VFGNLTGGLLMASASVIGALAGKARQVDPERLSDAEEADVVASFTGFAVERREQEDDWVCVHAETHVTYAGRPLGRPGGVSCPTRCLVCALALLSSSASAERIGYPPGEFACAPRETGAGCPEGLIVMFGATEPRRGCASARTTTSSTSRGTRP